MNALYPRTDQTLVGYVYILIDYDLNWNIIVNILVIGAELPSNYSIQFGRNRL